MARREGEHRLQAALEFAAPAAPLAAIHARAQAATTRWRLRQSVFGVIAVAIVMLAAAGPMHDETRIPTTHIAIPNPTAAPAPIVT